MSVFESHFRRSDNYFSEIVPVVQSNMPSGLLFPSILAKGRLEPLPRSGSSISQHNAWQERLKKERKVRRNGSSLPVLPKPVRRQAGYLGGQGPAAKQREKTPQVEKAESSSHLFFKSQSEARFQPNGCETDELLREIRGLTKSGERLERINIVQEKCQNGTLARDLARLEAAGSVRSSQASRRSKCSLILLARDKARILAAKNGEKQEPSCASSHRWKGSVKLGESAAVSVAGSAGEEVFQQEIRTVVEQEVGKLLAPLEKQLRSEIDRREKAELKVRKLLTGQAVSELPG